MALSRRRALGVFAAVIGSGVSGCLESDGGGDPTTDARAHRMTVTIRDGEFSPATLEVGAGREVTFVVENHDDRDHVVRGAFEEFELRVPAGERADRAVTVPERPGDYEITCSTTSNSLELTVVPDDLLSGCSQNETDE